jgi:transposase InsO family protein
LSSATTHAAFADLVDEPVVQPNGCVESFHARLRDEFLDGEIFCTLEEVQVPTERWRWQYNHVRPHSCSARPIL